MLLLDLLHVCSLLLLFLLEFELGLSEPSVLFADLFPTPVVLDVVLVEDLALLSSYFHLSLGVLVQVI